MVNWHGPIQWNAFLFVDNSITQLIATFEFTVVMKIFGDFLACFANFFCSFQVENIQTHPIYEYRIPNLLLFVFYRSKIELWY